MTQKSFLYHKSTQDEARFPCIGSRAIVNSPSNMPSGLTSFRQQQKFPKNPVKCPEKHEIQHSNSRKAPCTPKSLGKIADYQTSTKQECYLSTSTSEEASLSYMYVRETLSLLPIVQWTPRCPDSKGGWISLQ